MFHLPDKNWDLNDPDKKEKFCENDRLKFQLDTEETDQVLSDVKKYFFEEDTNTITANVNVFKEVITKPKLGAR